jgi:hypothetical protein
LLAARSNFEQVLKADQLVGDKWGIAENLEGLAGVAAKKGNAERAARIFGAAEVLRQTHELLWSNADRKLFEPLINDTHSQLGENDFAKARSAGRQMLDEGLDGVIAYALEPDKTPG